MLTIDMYYNSGSSTAVKTVLCTLLKQTYVETANYSSLGDSGSAFTSVVLNYPNLTLTGNTSTATGKFGFDSTWAGTNQSSDTTLGIVTGFSGTDYNAAASPTWDGQTSANAWLGLGIDRTDTASKKKNIMYNMNQ